MTDHAFSACWYRFRASFAQHRGAYFTLVLLVALLGGLAMASVAGARRTQSAFPTYLASTHPSDITVLSGFDDPALGLSSGYDPPLIEKIAHLPGVEGLDTYVGFDGNIDNISGIHLQTGAGQSPPVIEGSFDGEFAAQDQVHLISGRMFDPKRTDEAVMNAAAAEEAGLHVGSVVSFSLYSDKQEDTGYSGPAGRFVHVKIVGIVLFSRDVVEDDIARLTSADVLLTPALTRELAPHYSFFSFSALRLDRGAADDAKVQSEVAAILRNNSIGAYFTATTEAKAERAVKPESIALAVFGGIVGLAALLISAQVIGRRIRGAATEVSVLRALGASPSVTSGDALIGILGATLVGAILAMAFAVALSPIAPLGVVRPVYPDGGIAFDWAVLLIGFVVLVAALGAFGIGLAYHEAPHRRSLSVLNSTAHDSSVVRAVAASPVPVSAATGFRFALERGKGRSAAPVRSAILGTVLAAVILTATLVFGASLDSLASHPSLYGWNWNYAMMAGFTGSEDLPAPQIKTLLDRDHEVSAWSGVNFVFAKLDGSSEPMMTERPRASVAPPLLSGHGLESSDQVVLGVTTMNQLHKKLGESVILTTGSSTRRLVIVGTATMPSMGSGGPGPLEMGSGAIVATSNFSTSVLDAQRDPIPGPNAVLVRVRAGSNPDTAYRSLEIIERDINALANDDQPAGGIISLLRPAEIVNYRSMGDIPAYLGLGLALGSVIALGLTLTATVRRRRRDLAVLKMLGFTRRQLAAVVAWQSTTAVAIGTIIGIPLGIVLGRYLWDAFVRQIDAVPLAVVPVVSVVLVGMGGLVVANLVAALPGRIAAISPTAALMRSE